MHLYCRRHLDSSPTECEMRTFETMLSSGIHVRLAQLKCFIWIVAWLCFLSPSFFLVSFAQPSGSIDSAHLNHARCSVSEFQCRTDHLCIAQSRVADGIRDCPDGSDECEQDQFRCRCGTPICIDSARVLDGHLDCEDGSDEAPREITSECPAGNELVFSSGLADLKSIPKENHFVDTGQEGKNKDEDQHLPPSGFIEFTGTFVPFDQITVSDHVPVLPFYAVPQVETVYTSPVLEITGTFIPHLEMSTSTSATSMPGVTEMPLVEKLDNISSSELKDQVVAGTNKTFVIDSHRLSLFTALQSNAASPWMDAFVFACQLKETQCENIPIRLQLTPSDLQHPVLLVELSEQRVTLKVPSKHFEMEHIKAKQVHTSVGLFELSGVKVNNISDIKVSHQWTVVPFTSPVVFTVAPTDLDEVPIEMPAEDGNTMSASDYNVKSSTTLEEHTLDSLRFTQKFTRFLGSKRQMRTKTVGKLDEHFNQLSSEMKTKSLENYFPNGSIPIYSPTKIEATTSFPTTTKLLKTSSTEEIKNTSTIFGFIDFTTVVNGTLLVFTPKSRVEPSSPLAASIEPTKLTVFHDLIQSPKETTISKLESMQTYPKSSELMSSMPWSNSVGEEWSEPSATPMLQTSSGLTITRGFILPSATTSHISSEVTEDRDSNVVTSSSANFQPIIYHKRLTEYITEEDNRSLVTRSTEIFSNSTNYLPKEKIAATKPAKTYYTTYTYYTTFKNNETEFVHSRKEVVTNVVDLNSEFILPSSAQKSSTVINSTSTLTLHSALEQVPSLSAFVNATPSLDKTVSELQVSPSSSTLNKSYLGKLLSGIAVPITHYTTFTYYTTFFKDKTSQIVSRTKVISNIVTGTINLNQAIQKRSTEWSDIEPDGAENLPIIITPVTEYLKSTFYTTFFIPGQSSTVIANTHTFSNIYLPELSDSRVRQQTSKLMQSRTRIADRLMRTESITRIINGVPILDNSLAFDSNSSAQPFDKARLVDKEVERIQPTVTRRKVVVTRTRTLSGADSLWLNDTPRRSVVIVHGPPAPSGLHTTRQPEHTVAQEEKHWHQVGRLHPSVSPTPVTFYTTYTYFTTELVNGKPVVRSNEHLFSTVITGKVLPTRVLSRPFQRIRRTVNPSLLSASSAPELVNSEEVSDNKIESKTTSEMTEQPKTGVISEIRSNFGFQTVVTQIIGTLINGFYAQFAVTKTLEPNTVLATVENLDSNSLVEVTTQANEEPDAVFENNSFETTTEISQNESEETTLKPDMIEEAPFFTFLNDTEAEVTTCKSTLASTSLLVESTLQSNNSTAEIEESTHSAETLQLSTSSLVMSNLSNATSLTVTPSSSFESNTSPSSSESISIDFQTGLLSSTVESITEASQVVRITKETYGTYIGGIYAHLAKTRSDTISLPIKMISNSVMSSQEEQTITSTITSSPTNLITSTPTLASTPPLPSSSFVSSNFTSSTEDDSTSLSSKLEITMQIEESKSSWSPLPGLSSVHFSTDTVGSNVIVHTTEFYTTEINGFTAHYSRNTSNIVSTVEQVSLSRPSIHFPTPVRFLFSTKLPSVSTIYVTSTLTADQVYPSEFAGSFKKKYKEVYSDTSEQDYYEEPFTPSAGHLPRSRTIREKDSQPIADYEYDLDYADNNDKAMSEINAKASRVPDSLPVPIYKPIQPVISRSQTNGYFSRRYSGFGQRVGKQTENQESSPRLSSEEIRGRANRRRQPSRPVGVAPTTTRHSHLDHYNINDYVSKPSHSESVLENKPSSESLPTRGRYHSGERDRSRAQVNRGRTTWRRPTTSTTTTTTTTPPPVRNYALLPNQRLRLNRKYSRNRGIPASATSTNHEMSRDSHYREERTRHRGSNKSKGHVQAPILSHQPMVVESTVYATPTVPKVPITVTSIVTTVKTVPIFHGYRTSYATLTTTTLNTSVIPQSQYETSVNEDGMTRTVFTRVTDLLEPNKVTEVLVTTSALQEVKLVPIKFGYSTRTETLTDVKTFTMLTTIVNTENEIMSVPPPPPGSTLLTTLTSFVTTQTVSSTTAVSLLLHGKTLVSTLTFTSLTETTVTRTQTLTVAESASIAAPLVTQLTLSIRGDNGELTELVTAITVPLQPMLHTKVERDIKPSEQVDEEEELPPAAPHYHHTPIVLESSGSPPLNNFLSTSFKTVDQFSETHPFFITTIFKGSKTEIYEASAQLVDYPKDSDIHQEENRPIVFRKRKLQQFNDNIYTEPSEGQSRYERGKSATLSQRRPSFQRVRIKQSKPGTNRSPNESRLGEFNRLIGISEPSALSSSATQDSFRRVPISHEFNVYSSVPIPLPPSSSASYLLANNFQKPSFRRIKPQNSRRIVSSIRTIHPSRDLSDIRPSNVLASRLVHSSNFIEIPNKFGAHINLNQMNRGSSRNQFNLYEAPRASQLAGGERIEIYRDQPVDNTIHTPTIPLTYYTTHTYHTTVIRGQHTAHLSRESVISNVVTQALDKSIVEIVRDSDGVVEPTRIQNLGTKTKGAATTIYNALSQVQIYNEDLYNVIQKTYNKQIHFKPWQPASTYQPVFVTNHLEPPKEMHRPDWLNEFEAHDIESHLMSPSPTQAESTSFATSAYSYYTPVIKGSMEPVSEQATTTEKTPILEPTSLTSTLASKPLRSSIMLRRPFNSRFGHFVSRGRVSVKVKETPIDKMSVTETPTASLYLSKIEGSPVSSSIVRQTKSKIVVRPKNQAYGYPVMNTLNSKVFRISSRVVRPSSTLDLISSSVMSLSDIDGLKETSALVLNLSDGKQEQLDSIDHSDAARANKLVRVSNGVTLIMSSKLVTPSKPFTLEPTLVTGAAVLMKNIVPSQFETLLPVQNQNQVVSSSIQSSITTETQQIHRTSTLYSTLTYYATLFNGTSSSITPIEDVKTEYVTYPDSTVITKTIPSTSISPHSTLYTSEWSLNKTIGQNVNSAQIKLDQSSTTRSIYTTLTHYITLFHGTNTILSSIEEISPTVVTEVAGNKQSSTMVPPNIPNIRFTQASYDLVKQSKNLFGGLVPSLSTLYTTHTYYTTLFSGTTSIIQSREETTHSLITLYVPSSALRASSTLQTKPPLIMSTAAQTQIPVATIEASLPLDTHRPLSHLSSYYIPDISVEGSVELESSSAVIADPWPSKSSSRPSGIVYFSNFILPSSVPDSENTIEQAKGPVHTLLNHSEITLVNPVVSSTFTGGNQVFLGIEPSETQIIEQPQTQAPAIQPGAIIELSDLLDGADLAGNIGEAIKDIVQILAKGQKSKGQEPMPLEIDRTSVMQEMPPREGTTVSHANDPVYIPIYESSGIKSMSSSTTETTSSSTESMLEFPSVAYQPSSSVFPSASLVPSLHTTSSLSTSSPIDATSTLLPSPNEQDLTRFITNVEASPSTTTLTTTKVYYTRDSPLTITSEYIATLAPKTIVTTVVGSKTMVNTYSSKIEPTKSSSIPQQSVIRVQSKMESDRPLRPTRKPGVSRFKPPSRPTDPPKIFKTSHRPRAPYKPSPTPPPELISETESRKVKKTNKVMYPKTTTRSPILDIDQCKPACNAANKEICKEFDEKFKCDCRPGYTKKSHSDTCFELQNFIVLVRLTKIGENDVTWDSALNNQTSDYYQNLANAAKLQIEQAYMANDMKESYVGCDVTNINKASNGNGVLVNMTIHLTESNTIDQDILKDELTKTFVKNAELLPSPEQIYANLEDVIDFDECSLEEYNDCAASARCINEPGSYRCECLNGYPDLDLSNPGRTCASEIKACEFCYGRGDCFRDDTGQISSCKCHRMYLGRRCEINGLLLAIFIPVLAILCIVSICSIVYCCRKWRNRALVKGFRNFSAYGPNMIGSTLDRKAMLETSSDNSDPLRSHISYDGPGMISAEATLPREYRRRRESDHSSDRSLGSYQATPNAQYNFSPQFMIPRVRQTSGMPSGGNSHHSGHQGHRSHRHAHQQHSHHGHHSGHHSSHQSAHHTHHHSHHHHSPSYEASYGHDFTANHRASQPYMW